MEIRKDMSWRELRRVNFVSNFREPFLDLIWGNGCWDGLSFKLLMDFWKRDQILIKILQ